MRIEQMLTPVYDANEKRETGLFFWFDLLYNSIWKTYAGAPEHTLFPG